MTIKIEYFYVFINNFVSSSKKCSVYLTITDWVICSVAFVCVVYMFWAFSLIRNSSTQKIRNFPTLWGVSLLYHFCYCTQGFSFLYFFFLILFIAWARRILFRKSFLYLYFKFCPLYSEVQTKKKYSIKQKEKNPN